MTRMTSHLPIGGPWSLWRTVCLRGSGFPLARVDALTASTAARAADAWVAKERDGAPDVDDARAQALLAFEVDARMWRAAIRDAARDPLLREALAWQNPSFIQTCLDPLLKQPESANDARSRHKELAIATYLQRYCAKNDTIGFFGPVGWGEIGGQGLAVTPGPSLLARQSVYWEGWAIRVLAELAAEQRDLRIHAAPRRLPHARIEGQTLFYGVDQTTELEPLYARVLAACDGERSALSISHELSPDTDDVCEILDELKEQNLVAWTFELPNAGAHPEQMLASMFENIPAGEEVRANLARLEAAREAVQASAGDAAEVAAAQARCAAAFREITQRASERLGGQAYAGRTLLYNDARRDLELRIGEDVIAALAPALELVLHSARWFTFVVASRYRSALEACHATLGGGRIGWPRFWRDARALFVGDAGTGSIVGDTRVELQARWAELLRVDDEPHRIARSAGTLRTAVRDAFAAPHPGWPSARHHAPDVMMLAGGDGPRFVLGEMHVGMNALTNFVFVKEHPDPNALIRMREQDLPRAAIAPVWSDRRTRADFYSLSGHDYDLEVGRARSWRARSQVVSESELVVEATGNGLVVTTLDGRVSFDVIAFVEHHLIAESYAHFQLLPARAHSPRVTIDETAIARETWRIDPKACDFPAGKTIADRFLLARRFAARLGLPRRVFVRIPEETKPVYIDFDAPVLVEALAKLARRASAMTLVEMLPGVESCWLLDVQGRAYTSELRLAAVDDEPFPHYPGRGGAVSADDAAGQATGSTATKRSSAV
jgi:hypothetical protein